MGAMSLFNSLGIGIPRLPPPMVGGHEMIHVHRPLRRVMAFVGCSIDELCNDPMVKNAVFGYFKLYKEIHRRGEVRELERQWNPTGAGF
jgi:hypothetical protein